MMKLIYKSEYGTVEMGGTRKDKIRLTSLLGFGLPARDYSVVEFAGENGSTETGRKDLQRTITLSGEIEGNQSDIDRFLRTFYSDGDLIIFSDDIRRKISCKLVQCEEIGRNARSNINSFVIQLSADYPYFRDVNDLNIPLFTRKNLITDTFTLPCVFTERLSKGECDNRGDKTIYPVITIKNNGLASENNMVIENETTGAKITLSHNMVQNETVTINLATRKIISDVSGNITDSITDDTILSDFFLQKGKNTISFTNGSNNENICATVIYSPEYLTATR